MVNVLPFLYLQVRVINNDGLLASHVIMPAIIHIGNVFLILGQSS